MIEVSKPYVVSSDVGLLLNRWGEEAGYSVPDAAYLAGMAQDLKSTLGECADGSAVEVEVVGQKEIRDGINTLASKIKIPLVSLDRAYVDGATPNIIAHLDVSRFVNNEFRDIGLFPRPGFPPIEKQLRRIAKKHPCPIALVDDVIFSAGDLVKEDGTGICDQLARLGSPVKLVMAGIGVGEGIEKLRTRGIEVVCVREYPEVIDEVCERDFLACIPMSGRTLKDGPGQLWSAPYLRPFGNPEKWASIRADRAREFSDFCLSQSIILWSIIEKLSQASIPTEAVPRRIKGLTKNISVVKALGEHKV